MGKLHFDRVQVYQEGKLGERADVLLQFEGGTSRSLSNGRFIIVPGFADVHVHLREPGFSYKETIASGTAAAARGGYTTVCAMPNLKPVPDSAETLAEELAIIDRDARIGVVPYAAITKGEKGEALSDMDALAASGRIAGFSDDGRGVQREEIMRRAMLEAKRLGKPIVAHCEDNAIAGTDSESEWGQVKRDLALVRETGCAYHVCHVSAKESVELIRRAKREGLNVTCETAPHYLLLDRSMVEDDGRFKMNPPIRGKEDRAALIGGLSDGTIGMIATDHAPHSAEEKSRGFADSLMGVVGLETAFPALYTTLVREEGALSLERLIALLADEPRRRFGLAPAAVPEAAAGGGHPPQAPPEQSYSVWDLNAAYTVDPAEFASMGKSTPFAGRTVYGRCLLTVYRGKAVWQEVR